MGEQVNTRRRTAIADDHEIHLALTMAKDLVRSVLMSNTHGDQVSVTRPELGVSSA